MSSPLMTPQQRLEALERLEQRQVRSQRTAVISAWGSVALALAVLAGLIVVGSRKVNELNAQKGQIRSEIDGLIATRDAARREAEEAEKKRLAAVWTLSNVPEAQQKQAVEQQLSRRPEMAGLLPRIYMHTVTASDRQRAEAVRKALQQEGYLVLGIENRPDAARFQKGSDVRYYRTEEADTAKRIAKILEKAGEQNVRTFTPKGMENSPKVRPNHFEVWLASSASDGSSY